MKAFLIDPYTKTVSEVDYDGDYKSIYKLIDCRIFTVFGPVGEDDSVFIDDEGMLESDNPVWSLKTIPGTMIAKRGLVLGTDDEGDSIAPQTTTLGWLQENVVWSDKVSTGDFTPGHESVVDHPIMGRVPAFIGGGPILKDRTEDESVEG